MSGYLTRWRSQPDTPAGRILKLISRVGDRFHHTECWDDGPSVESVDVRHGESEADAIERVVYKEITELEQRAKNVSLAAVIATERNAELEAKLYRHGFEGETPKLTHREDWAQSDYELDKKYRHLAPYELRRKLAELGAKNERLREVLDDAREVLWNTLSDDDLDAEGVCATVLPKLHDRIHLALGYAKSECFGPARAEIRETIRDSREVLDGLTPEEEPTDG